MKKIGILSAVVGFTIVMLTSCQQSTPMSAAEQTVMIDSIVEARTADLQAEMDSMCTANFEAEVQARVDSLLEVNK